MHLSVDTTGVTHLRHAIDRIGPRVRKEAGVAVRTRAHDIENLAKQNVPVDTGYLKSTIGVSMGVDDLIAVVGASANYAHFVEYGTAKMAPRPFLGPAFEAVRPAFEADIAAIMKDPLR